jgi:hypothetical protein
VKTPFFFKKKGIKKNIKSNAVSNRCAFAMPTVSRQIMQKDFFFSNLHVSFRVSWITALKEKKQVK